MLEIGSEFHMSGGTSSGQAEPDWLQLGTDQTFVFSGRTAIETALRNARLSAGTALLPSYCCSSMVEPFENAGLALRFYEVDIEQAHFRIRLDIPADCTVLLRCNYFGFQTDYPEDMLAAFRQRGGIIIEDITHSLLSRTPYHDSSDYLVASLRKWGALLSGGLCCKTCGSLFAKPVLEPDAVFLNAKQRAMQEKAAYLQGMPADKQHFLQLFRESNQWLADHYSGRAMDRESLTVLRSWDSAAMRLRRRENAQILYAGINGLPGIRPLFAEDEMDCPLFVPVLLQTSDRQRLLQTLIAHAIYCPVHWPKPPYDCSSALYEQELSLICDQRYSAQDMQRMAAVIRACQTGGANG